MYNLLDDISDDHVEELRLENQILVEKVTQLEKALTKAKDNHRKFVSDVVESEEMRNREFDNEKKNLKEENKRLIEQYRQVSKDLTFYRTGFEELIHEAEKNASTISTSTSTRSTTVFHSSDITPTTPSKNRTDGIKVITRTSDKLYRENNILREKISKLTKDRQILRAKVKQLENFKNSMNKKSTAHLNYLKELEQLVDTSKVKNGKTFNSTILAKLGDLSKCY